MAEEENKEEEKSEEEDEVAPLLDQSKEQLRMYKEENDRRRDILKREEKLANLKMIGGGSEAGRALKKPNEETPHDYRDRVTKEMAAGKTEFGN